MAKLVAHRGVSAQRKENTLAAFELAISLGLEYIEFDIRRTKDGVLVVNHDEDIAGILISSLCYDEIRKNPAFSHIPTLEETARTIRGRIKAYVEIKDVGFEMEIIDTLKKHLSTSEFVIISFYDESVRRVKQCDPTIRAGLLLGLKINGKVKIRLDDVFPAKRLRESRADFMGPRFTHLMLPSTIHSYLHNIPIYFWTINRPRTFWLLSKIGNVEAIASDIPASMTPQLLGELAVRSWSVWR